MDAWARSACYPRSTFYLMSDGPSTRDHRITKTYFRTCSTYVSRSQAPLCACTRLMIANHDEGTLVVLRYFFGGDRPSQTARLPLSGARIHGTPLEFSCTKAGISTAAPLTLACQLQSLPAILHIEHKNPIIACSKGSRGLSVLPRVCGIFTTSSISPSLSWRHRRGRYAIHAGRNLPAKGLRYLRTVIVTAAVNQSLGSELRLR
jgi:hypothetical protein